MVAFLYGHTHAQSLIREGHRVLINTGSWLRRFRAVSTWVRFLPDVYWPSFCLNYFKIHAPVEGR